MLQVDRSGGNRAEVVARKLFRGGKSLGLGVWSGVTGVLTAFDICVYSEKWSRSF